jgi:hypothetical protein
MGAKSKFLPTTTNILREKNDGLYGTSFFLKKPTQEPQYQNTVM